MDDVVATERLSLFDALLHWVDPQLIENIRGEERRRTAWDLATLRWPRLIKTDECRQPSSTGWMAGGVDFVMLEAAWSASVDEFRRLIERGAIHLSGIAFGGDLQGHREAIPGEFAAKMRFDLNANTLKIGKQEFIAIAVSSGSTAATENGVLTAAEREPRGAVSVTELTDEEIFQLLEEHAKRVVKSASPKFSMAGKYSVMPIIARKMEHRAGNGQLLSKLADEAEFLEGWIALAIPSHQTPSKRGIANALRYEYSQLKT